MVQEVHILQMIGIRKMLIIQRKVVIIGYMIICIIVNQMDVKLNTIPNFLIQRWKVLVQNLSEVIGLALRKMLLLTIPIKMVHGESFKVECLIITRLIMVTKMVFAQL